jgi:hypothetical protein
VALFAAGFAAPAFATTAHTSTTHSSHHATARRGASHSAAGHAGAASRSTGQVAHTTQGAHAARGPHKKAAPKLHGQQAIKPERVTEIQQALIRAHYLSGEASGQWDATTKAAMQKYQADQGWQTKLMPDSRAIKKLGLGPDYSNAINAKSASSAPPAAAGTTPPAQAEGFAEAAGVKQ